jgi:hypothetical protein
MTDSDCRDMEIGRVLGRLDAIERDLVQIKDKLGVLTEAFAMGRGAFRTMAKMGGLLLVLAGGVAWLADRLPAWWGRP